MPLIKVEKKKKEAPYVFTNYEKWAVEHFLFEEQVKSTNHDPHLLDLMVDDEKRDADPIHVRYDVYAALNGHDSRRLLDATKNLTVAERNRVAQGIYYTLIAGTAEDCKRTTESGKRITDMERVCENARRLILFEDIDIDLFDLCARLDDIKFKLK